MGLDTIKKSIFKTFSASELDSALKKDYPLFLKNVSGSLISFICNYLSEKEDTLLVILPDEEKARFLTGDLLNMGLEDTLFFPTSNKKPYQSVDVAESQSLVERAEVLDAVINDTVKVLVTSAQALSEKVISPKKFKDSSIDIHKGEEYSMDALREELLDNGYVEVKFVDRPGEIAVRGGIFDVFPLSGDYPVRFEFFGDEIDSIRHFDADSQRSISFLNTVKIVPNSTVFHSTGREHLLNYFSDKTTILSIDALLLVSETNKVFETADTIYGSLKDKADDINEGHPLPNPSDLFTTGSHLIKQLTHFKTIYSGTLKPDFVENLNEIDFKTKRQPEFSSTIKLLKEEITQNSKAEIETYILCDSEGQKERFEELLGDPSITYNYFLSTETLHEGFIYEDAGIAVFTDHQIFNRYHRPKVKKRKVTGGISFKELKDLNIGDFVVHVDFGIGKFAGFKKIKVKDTTQEVVVLKYLNDSILYVNVSNLFKIQKYSGKDGHQPKITKLGGTEWARKKANAKARVKDIARELIRLYAQRKLQKAHSFPPDNYMQTEMEAAFMFEETPDQMKAIEDVKADMMDEKPMDRLVCGDVGFGKTEVAVRAAFKAALDSKQVAVLVPTTILADQHFKTFKRRMDLFPINIEVLSRFRTKAEQKIVLEKVKKGEVDILIGTHRITSKDVEFKNLGLMIVDEEQRFGVSTKEKIKRFKASVDVLTLTATPIPRTLQFSLMGARDLSVINTPPENRQPVQTEIISFSQARIQDAIIYEISRGGQLFFIHNRVQNIEEVSNMIMDMVPNIKVRYAHGQMKPSELEKIIYDFYNHKFDVLVSTNIVENGIDIANANTIIINHADRFGLSELHQLRGRVGRSNRKAFCYLVSPPFEVLTMESRKRLMALVEFDSLGSGFNIAMRDLDIRGAGDILGGEQSGFIADVGFELYQKILNDAVKELKQSEFSDMFEDFQPGVELPETTVEFDLSAMLPSYYVSDNVERLNLYRRLSLANDEKDIDNWRQEIEDRFGKPPEASEHLVDATRIKLFASQLYIIKVTVRAGKMWLVCPDGNSEAGKEFYEKGKMQEIIARIQETGNELQITQKDNTVRLVVSSISGLKEAALFLNTLNQSFKGNELKVVE